MDEYRHEHPEDFRAPDPFHKAVMSLDLLVMHTSEALDWVADCHTDLNRASDAISHDVYKQLYDKLTAARDAIEYVGGVADDWYHENIERMRP